MIKHLSRLGLVAAMGVMATGIAFAGPISVTSISLTASAPGASADTLSVIPGIPFDTFTSSLGTVANWTSLTGWSVSGNITAGMSPIQIDLDTNSAACFTATGSGCGQLTMTLDITGLTSSPALLQNSLEAILTGAVTSGTGTVTQTAYIGGSQIGNMLDSQGARSWNLTTIGPMSGSYSSFDLKLVQTFTASCTGTGSNGLGCVVYNSADGSIVSAPEPGALAMFGAGLLGCALFINRRRRAARQS